MMPYVAPVYPLAQTITILAPSRASDGKGGWTTTFASTGTVSGRIYPRPSTRDTEEISAGKETVRATHRGIIPAGTTISEDYRIQEGSTVYRITLVLNPGNLSRHLELELLEIE